MFGPKRRCLERLSRTKTPPRGKFNFLSTPFALRQVTGRRRPFITMVRKDTASVLQAGDRIQAGQTAVATVDGHKYALQVYKQPKT